MSMISKRRHVRSNLKDAIKSIGASIMSSTNKACVFSILICSFVAVSATSYYSYDGRGNNLIHDNWGSVFEYYLRVQVPPAVGYGATGDMSSASSTNPREVSKGLALPSYKSRKKNADHKTDMLTYIGQFFEHDIDLTFPGSDIVADAMTIDIDFCDLRFNKEKCGDALAPARQISMFRSHGETQDGVLQQMNWNTAFLDGSGLYGKNAQTADLLRSRYRGQMRTFNGELPKNTFLVAMNNPSIKETTTELRASGDYNANENPVLLALTSLFLREHNRLAAEIYREHSSWNDEQIYQESRKWNVAQMQSICYYEYLPILGIEIPSYSGYKSTVNPGIDNFFAAVSKRFRHSEINEVFARIDEDGKCIDDDYIPLAETFYFPTYGLSTGIEPLLRGAAMMQQSKASPHFASSVQNALYGPPYFGGSDLFAEDIKRSRDHGMPTYNEARSALGLLRATKFSDITSDIYLQKQLEAVYGTVDEVEALTGGLAEDPYGGSSVGELFYKSIRDQFTRIRDGDRFYFENTANGLFTASEIDQIRNTGLRDIILRNTDIQTLPENIFIANPDQPWPIKSLSSEEPSSMPSTESTSTASKTLRADVYAIEWEPETINGVEYMRIKLMCKTNGWVGFGIAQDASSDMINADITIVQFSNGVATIHDYFAQTFAQPQLDTSLGGTDDVQLISGSHVNGIATVEFRKKVAATDAFDHSIRKTGETPVIFAWHDTSTDLIYHTPTNRGDTTIDFYAALDSNPPTTPIPPTQTSGSGSITIDSNKDLKFTWNIEVIDGVEWINAEMNMQIDGPSWMGIVVEGPSGGWNDADLIKVESNDIGECSVRDYWTETSSEILLDASIGGTDDAISSFCYVSGGNLEFEFKRKIDTGDSFDRVFDRNGYTDITFFYDTYKSTMDTSTMQKQHYKIDVFASEWMNVTDVLVSEPTTPSTPISEPTPTEPEPVEEPAVPVSTTGEITLDETSSFVLNYELFKEEIIFTLSFKGAGFAAIGIPGESMNMIDADIFAAVEDGNGGCSVEDYWSTGFVAPVEDASSGGSNDLANIECSIDGDTLTASFKRALSTGDSMDREIDPVNIPIIYAFSTNAGGLQYHGFTGRGSKTIEPDLSVFEEATEQPDVTDSKSEDQPSFDASIKMLLGIASKGSDFGGVKNDRKLFITHMWFAGLGFGLFGVAAMMIERFGRGWSQWRKGHIQSQTLSIFFVFISEIIALAQSKGHLEYAHYVLAYFLFFISIPQSMISLYAYDKYRSVAGWKKFNRILDCFVYILGFLQFWMALRLLDANIKAFQLFFAYSFSIIGVLIFIPRNKEDLSKELPLTTKEKPKKEDSKPTPPPKKKEQPSVPSSSKPLPPRKSCLERAVSRKSDMKIPAYRPEQSIDDLDDKELVKMTEKDFQDKIAEGKQWTVINDKVYDMEEFMDRHPGGEENIEDLIGKDGTELYLEAHETSLKAREELENHLIGELEFD